MISQDTITGILLIFTGVVVLLIGVMIWFVEERFYYRLRMHRTRAFNPVTGIALTALGLFCLWQGIATLVS
jgi:threonine/homoserine/homoserine lactone efflux protein